MPHQKINVRWISDPEQIEAMLPQCAHLAQKAGCSLPFQYGILAWRWFQHFRSHSEESFADRRGRNFLGSRSRTHQFWLLLAESEGKLVGFVPIVESEIVLKRGMPALHLLHFAGDSVTLFYRDFTVLPDLSTDAAIALMHALCERADTKGATVLLAHMPPDASHLPALQAALARRCMQRNLEYAKSKVFRRGGVLPWTILELIKHLQKLAIMLPELAERIHTLVSKLEKQGEGLLLFRGTRGKLESELRDLVILAKTAPEATETCRTLHALMSAQPIDYPFLTLPASEADFMQQFGSSTRYYFRRYLRKFAAAGGFFEILEPAQIKAKDVDHYLALHLARWGRASVAINEKTLPFHKELSLDLASRGQLRLFFAQINGERVAAQACIDIGRRREYYFSGRKVVDTKLPIGKLLCFRTITDAIARGFAEYDFGYGGDEYKAVFTRDVRHLQAIVFGKNLPDLDLLMPKFELLQPENENALVSGSAIPVAQPKAAASA